MGDISWYGGFMSASSIRVIPTLQMSAYIQTLRRRVRIRIVIQPCNVVEQSSINFLVEFVIHYCCRLSHFTKFK